MKRLAFFGGVYSNALALEAAIADARARDADAMYCLGDLGAFGPHPDDVFPLLRNAGVQCIQGNYDHSIGNALSDCQCGYTDPRDNYFAQISYNYTLANTSQENRDWLRALPSQMRLSLQGRRVLLCHGSPRKTNEFLWESTTSDGFLNKLFVDYQADVILATHTGIKWQRELANDKLFVNVGVLGRPENDGTPSVWYTLLTWNASDRAQVEFIPVTYDQEEMAARTRKAGLPNEFAETLTSGWWTTCLEVLPSKERLRGKY